MATMKEKIRKTISKKLSKILPYPLFRYLTSYFYNKEKFLLGKSGDVFAKIYDLNFWNSDESKSGEGSTLEATENIRKLLPQIISKYNIKSMLDAPCGDYNWMSQVEKDCIYIGGDIVDPLIANNQKNYSSEKVSFIVLDITKDKIPNVDLIFCKDCLQHLSYEKVRLALNNFKNSGFKYLLVTSYPKTWRNHDIHDGDYRPLNLFKSPFNLPKPITKIEEPSKISHGEPDKTMYLYELNSLPYF